MTATALLFRSIDQQVCDAFPPGTHFLWHLFNGGMLYCLFAGLVAGAIPGGSRDMRRNYCSLSTRSEPS